MFNQSGANKSQPNTQLLSREIQKYVKQGYRVVHQTETTAQLVRPKRFSLILALLGLAFFIVGLIIYVLYYMAKKDDVIYLELTTNIMHGEHVKVTKG